MSYVISSFDVIGDIAIIEIPKELERKERKIAQTLLKLLSNIRVVCKKTGAHKGIFRIEPVKMLAVRKGQKKDLKTVYKEFGSRMKVHIGKVFFSPRLATERKRIADLVKQNEVVGVWFAGVGPFAFAINRFSKPKEIIAIELNPKAVELLKENTAMNKATDRISAVKGDVKKLFKKYREYFDRIVMPMPKTGETFLKEAFFSIKPKGTIHFYTFADKDRPFDKAIETIKAEAEKREKKIKIVNKKIIREYSPSKVQVVIDLELV